MTSRSILNVLLAIAVIGPLTVLVLFGVGRLLTSMGDEAGGLWLWRSGWVGAAVLLIALFAIVVVLATDAISRDRRPPDDGTQ